MGALSLSWIIYYRFGKNRYTIDTDKKYYYIIIFNRKVFPSSMEVEKKFFLQTSNSAEIEIETLLNSFFFLDKMLYFSTWSILQL